MQQTAMLFVPAKGRSATVVGDDASPVLGRCSAVVGVVKISPTMGSVKNSSNALWAADAHKHSPAMKALLKSLSGAMVMKADVKNGPLILEITY